MAGSASGPPIRGFSRETVSGKRGVETMRKTGVLIVAAAVAGLYFWFSGSDEPAEPKLSQPKPAAPQPAWQAPPPPREAAREAAPWRGPADWQRQAAQGYPAAPYGGDAYGGGYRNGAAGSHTTQLGGYQFRPLDEREREKMEQQRPESYPTYRARPSDPTYRGTPVSPGVEGFARPYAMQEPAPHRYTYRPYDAERAAKSWTGNYPPVGGYAADAMRDPYASGSYAQDPRSNPNRALSGYGPLWAAGGAVR